MTTLEQLRAKGVTPTRLTADSRRVRPGDIFVAFPGAHVDGRDFIAQAVARGAAAVLVEAGGGVAAKVGAGDTAMVAVEGLAALSGEIAHIVYGRPSEKLWVAGITGTNGKTSISQWIAQAMDALPSLPQGRPKAETALRMESPSDEPPSSLSMGRRRGFAEHCSAPPQPAGCAKPAVEQGTGDRSWSSEDEINGA